jgi:hypothetical protein
MYWQFWNMLCVHKDLIEHGLSCDHLPRPSTFYRSTKLYLFPRLQLLGNLATMINGVTEFALVFQ